MNGFKEPADPCGGLLLAIVAAWAGHLTVSEQPRAKAIGGFAGVVVFLASVANGLAAAEMPVRILVASLTRGCFAVALAWVLAAVLFAGHSALTGGIRRAGRRLRSWAGVWSRWRSARPSRQPQTSNRATEAEAASARAEAERQARDAANARRRREEARAKAEIFFNLHGPELGTRFTRAMFDEFVGRHLGEERTPDEVEARAEQLMEVIRQHLAKVKPVFETQTIGELLTAFAAREQNIQTAPMDPRDKKLLLIELQQERNKAITRALREGRL